MVPGWYCSKIVQKPPIRESFSFQSFAQQQDAHNRHSNRSHFARVASSALGSTTTGVQACGRAPMALRRASSALAAAAAEATQSITLRLAQPRGSSGAARALALRAAPGDQAAHGGGPASDKVRAVVRRAPLKAAASQKCHFHGFGAGAHASLAHLRDSRVEHIEIVRGHRLGVGSCPSVAARLCGEPREGTLWSTTLVSVLQPAASCGRACDLVFARVRGGVYGVAGVLADPRHALCCVGSCWRRRLRRRRRR